MKSGIKTAVVATVALLAISGTGLVGYTFLADSESSKKLEKFGYAVLPASFYDDTVGALGHKQVPATFAEEKLTPTQKVVQGLRKDKENLIKEQEVLREQIAELEKQVMELSQYKRLNEHFAPDNIADETAAVETELKRFLVTNPAAARFSNIQIEIMSAASAIEYRRYISHNRLILNDKQRSSITNNFLPEFAFCVGDGAELAANNSSELIRIAEYFRQEDQNKLNSALKQDLNSVVEPCQSTLYEQFATISNVNSAN
ncbi:hypothetical protein [Marinobacterium jannaschii]|uniref:hypothetical protein n=1 Tax=Marinobacterium jannaschii TaxID=64970 RepID=UPI0004864FB4|nr:hypothetical protein [Marinobacterium jannaschii]